MQLEVSRTRTATPGMQAFTRLETVDGQPLVTTLAVFIPDFLWEQMGEPQNLTITMEAPA